MKKGITVLRICLLTLVLLGAYHQASAATVTVTLTQTSPFSRIDFDSAYTMVWSGDVFFGGIKIGEFNAQLTKTNTTGANGYATQYDIVIVPGGGATPEFLSARTIHFTTGSGSDNGMIFAASSVLKGLVGASVVMTGSSATVTY